jgi:hypothetical protein
VATSLPLWRAGLAGVCTRDVQARSTSTPRKHQRCASTERGQSRDKAGRRRAARPNSSPKTEPTVCGPGGGLYPVFIGELPF